MKRLHWYVSISFVLIFIAGSTGCGGIAVPLTPGTRLGKATIEGSGESRQDGEFVGNILPVTQVIAAASGRIPGWTYSTTPSASNYPFTGTPVLIGQPVTDGQTELYFSYTYPSNNFQLSEAHVVIDTKRDN